MLPARNDRHLLVFVRSLKAWRGRVRMQWGAWCRPAALLARVLEHANLWIRAGLGSAGSFSPHAAE